MGTREAAAPWAEEGVRRAAERFSAVVRGPVASRPVKKAAQVPVYDRIKAYPKQTFFVAGDGKMGCRACFGKSVELHKYRIEAHISGKKHMQRVRQMLETDESDKVSDVGCWHYCGHCCVNVYRL